MHSLISHGDLKGSPSSRSQALYVRSNCSKLGAELHVVGLVDPDNARAAAALESKLASGATLAYASCKIFASIDEAAHSLSGDLLPQCVANDGILSIVLRPPCKAGHCRRTAFRARKRHTRS